MDTWLWIVIAVVVAVIVIAAVAVGMSKKRQLDRKHAEAMRTDVAHRTPGLRQREAEAQGVEAEAQQARAEADRLDAVANERRERVDNERSSLHDQLREADRVDPDTKPRRSDAE